MKIIPAIDLIGGRCVRLTKGKYETKKEYSQSPLEVAKAFEDAGLQYLHLVDLEGAKARRIVQYKVLETLASKTKLHIDFGGGIQTEEDLKIAFSSGAQQVTGGSIAARSPTVFLDWLNRFGTEKIILGADTLDGNIATHGWTETGDQEVQAFIATYLSKGLRHVICTDIQKDGMLEGPSFDLYKTLLVLPDIQLIASGGIHALEDLDGLRQIGCSGAIIGKAIYENRISLPALSRWIEENTIEREKGNY